MGETSRIIWSSKGALWRGAGVKLHGLSYLCWSKREYRHQHSLDVVFFSKCLCDSSIVLTSVG